jgi:hypothetical protein
MTSENDIGSLNEKQQPEQQILEVGKVEEDTSREDEICGSTR